jgi:hypothetical protein
MQLGCSQKGVTGRSGSLEQSENQVYCTREPKLAFAASQAASLYHCGVSADARGELRVMASEER